MTGVGEVVRGWRNGTLYPAIPRTLVVLHNTQTNSPVSTYQSAGGWQRLIGRDGTIYRDVPDGYAAWHVAATGQSQESKRLTRWRPSVLKRCPDGGVSDANYSALGIELEGFDQKYTEWQYAALKRVLWDWNEKWGVQMCVTHGQLQTDRTDPVRFDYEGFFGSPFAWETMYQGPKRNPLNEAYLWPLPGVSWQDPLRGGLNFLEWTDSGHTPHPAVDLNIGDNCADDAGMPVVSPAKGTVVFTGYDDSTTRSVGNHVWVKDTEGLYHHLCHFQSTPAVRIGQEVVVGTLLGKCGKTKGWPCEHLHWEIMRQLPVAWNFWPYNWSQQQVAAAYLDPLTWMVVRGSNGMEPGNVAALNDAEAYNVINNQWVQRTGREADSNSAHYKAVLDLWRTEGFCPMPAGPEYPHGHTQDGKVYNSQGWQDGRLSVWVDGMEKASFKG